LVSEVVHYLGLDRATPSGRNRDSACRPKALCAPPEPPREASLAPDLKRWLLGYNLKNKKGNRWGKPQ
jgi:hypothetical protein